MLGRYPATETPRDPVAGSLRRVESAVPWRVEAAALALMSHERKLIEVKLAPAPSLAVEFPSTEELQAGGGSLRWSIAQAPEQSRVAVRISENAGRTWTIVHQAPAASGHLDLRGLFRGASSCFIEVVASSGFHFRSERRGPFALRTMPRSVQTLVLNASADGRVPGTIELFAIPDGRTELVIWTSDVDGPLGTGHRLRVRLSAGDHVIEARSPRAFEASAQLKVQVEAERTGDRQDPA
jgi:hypothetical protein